MNTENGSILLSVVIPYYNQPEELHDALQSLHGQTLKELEVIVVDDASGRGCDGVISEFSAKGLPVRLLRQEKRSFTLQARLRGMAQARGRWLAFMDSDDALCSPEAYAQVVREAEDKAVDLLHFVTLANDNGGRPCEWRNASPFFRDVVRGKEIFSAWLELNAPAHSVWNKLYSARLYKKIVELNHDVHIYRIEDLYLTAHFLFFAVSYAPSDTAVYMYSPSKGLHLEKVAARSLDTMRMYMTLPGRFKQWGLGEATALRFKTLLRKFVTLNTGHMCRFLTQGDVGKFFQNERSEAVERILRYGTPQDFFAALLIANASNARKLQNIFC